MAVGDVNISECNGAGSDGSADAVGLTGKRNRPMLNTQHLPGIGPDASQATIAAEQFRARVGTKPSPADDTLVWVEGHLITKAQWEQFKTDRFHTWHGEGWIMSVDHWVTQH